MALRKCLICICLVSASQTESVPINVFSPGDNFEVYHFRVNSGSNSAGFASGDVLTFGLASVVPNGYGEDAGVPVKDAAGNPAPPTTAVARQNGVTRELMFEADMSVPNLYSGGTDYDETFTGPWEIELTNGPDTLFVDTPAVGDTRMPGRVSGMRLMSTGDPTEPMFSWVNTDPDADAVRLSVYDLSVRDLAGQAQAVYRWPKFVAGETSHTIPAGELEPDGIYAVQVETRILRESGTGPSGQSLAGSNLSVNRTWFDFTTGEIETEDDVYLPEIGTNSDGNPVFSFDNLVEAELVEFYDPVVAIGYDYAIGEGNPFFNSFILPEVGDDLFDLYLYDESLSEMMFETVVVSGSEYFFQPGGVDRFRILGIEGTVGLDPNDGTAFVTGLSFVSDGRFTGTMTPILAAVGTPAPVPLPASLPLLAFSLLGAFGMLRRGRSAA